MSPSTVADVRMKNFEQLRYIKQLCDDNIIMTNSLRNINKTLQRLSRS